MRPGWRERRIVRMRFSSRGLVLCLDRHLLPGASRRPSDGGCSPIANRRTPWAAGNRPAARRAGLQAIRRHIPARGWDVAVGRCFRIILRKTCRLGGRRFPVVGRHFPAGKSFRIVLQVFRRLAGKRLPAIWRRSSPGRRHFPVGKSFPAVLQVFCRTAGRGPTRVESRADAGGGRASGLVAGIHPGGTRRRAFPTRHSPCRPGYVGNGRCPVPLGSVFRAAGRRRPDACREQRADEPRAADAARKPRGRRWSPLAVALLL